MNVSWWWWWQRRQRWTSLFSFVTSFLSLSFSSLSIIMVDIYYWCVCVCVYYCFSFVSFLFLFFSGQKFEFKVDLHSTHTYTNRHTHTDDTALDIAPKSKCSLYLEFIFFVDSIQYKSTPEYCNQEKYILNHIYISVYLTQTQYLIEPMVKVG